SPPHVADLNWHIMPLEEIQPANLIVLQTIARSFDLYHPIALLIRPELDKIGKAAAVASQIQQHALEPKLEVLRRYAVKRLHKQLFGDDSPGDEGVLNALFTAKF